MSRRSLATVGVIVVGLAAGCGSSHDTASALALEGKEALEEIGQMLQTVAGDRQKPPAKMADLAAVEGYLPTASAKIRNGEVVYLWGAPYVAGGNKVVAYEKKVPTDGGYVLLEDGSVKQMTASEFQSAPRAK